MPTFDEFDRKEFGRRIKELRLKAGYTSQEGFANATGLSNQAISFYENGARLPDASVIACFAKTLNCTADYLLLMENSPTHDVASASEVTGLSVESVAQLGVYNEQAESCRKGSNYQQDIDSLFFLTLMNSLIGYREILCIAELHELWVASLRKKRKLDQSIKSKTVKSGLKILPERSKTIEECIKEFNDTDRVNNECIAKRYMLSQAFEQYFNSIEVEYQGDRRHGND